MRAYLSHGMGVNSTALMLFLEDQGIEFESVFVNHGGDFPETYEYLEYLQGEGYQITEIKPEVEGCSTIYDYCLKWGIMPSVHFRWCTDKFKLRPLKQYIETPCIMFIGIDYGESKRALMKPLKKGVFNCYPFINNQVDRDECIRIIEKHSLKVPPRSGCYFCPFLEKHKIRDLYLNYPGLYEKRKEIEQRASERYGEQVYLRCGKTTAEWAMEDIPELTDWGGGL